MVLSNLIGRKPSPVLITNYLNKYKGINSTSFRWTLEKGREAFVQKRWKDAQSFGNDVVLQVYNECAK